MPLPAPVTTAIWFWRRGMVFPLLLVFQVSLQTNSKLQGAKRKALPARYIHSAWCCPMDRQLSEWKLGVERICSAAAPDYAEAARLAADIARASKEAILRQAATQALPILRNASANNADPITKDAARRRLGGISDVLHTLGTQQFGKRQTDPKPLALPEPYRQMLRLPPGPRPSRP